MRAETPVFWDLTLRPAESAAALRIGASDALFCARLQKLSSLNATAARIWRSVAASGSCQVAADDLEALGAAARDARAYVGSAVSNWLETGHLVPHLLIADAAITRRYAIGPVAIQLDFSGAADVQDGEDVLGAFARRRVSARNH